MTACADRVDHVGTTNMRAPMMPGGAATALLVYALAVIMAGITLPAPMDALYTTAMGFTVLTTTVIYAAYAAVC